MTKAAETRLGEVLTAKRLLEHAQFCAEHLLKKGWYAPKGTDVFGEEYHHLHAYTASLVIAYATPYTETKKHGALIRGSLPGERRSEKRKLHRRVMDARHKLIAHVDPARVNSDLQGETFTYRAQLAAFSKADLDLLVEIITTTTRHLDEEFMQTFPNPPAPTPPPLASGSAPA